MAGGGGGAHADGAPLGLALQHSFSITKLDTYFAINNTINIIVYLTNLHLSTLTLHRGWTSMLISTQRIVTSFTSDYFYGPLNPQKQISDSRLRFN